MAKIVRVAVHPDRVQLLYGTFGGKICAQCAVLPLREQFLIFQSAITKNH
jgi:hypothetical protein